MSSQMHHPTPEQKRNQTPDLKPAQNADQTPTRTARKTTAFRNVQQLEGARVRMCFNDGHEVVATLLSATTDTDGSRHLIYDEIEWANHAGTGSSSTCYYADAATLISIEGAGESVAGATRG